jgi:hypothetical protein
MPLGTLFGPGIQIPLVHLHHSHHVGSEQLSRMLNKPFGLSISLSVRLSTPLTSNCGGVAP